MPLTINSFIIIVFGILPGLLGNMVFEYCTDTNLKESQTDKVFRIILFTVLGIIIYILFFIKCFNTPLPVYLFSETYQNGSFTSQELFELSISFLGHITCSTITGFISAKITKNARISNISNSWRIFSRSYLDNRWVIVALKNGKKYAGYISICDPSSEANERDIVISEPALYDETKKDYLSSNLQHLFLPGSFIDSVAVVYEPKVDDRICKPGTPLFQKDPKIQEEN